MQQCIITRALKTTIIDPRGVIPGIYVGRVKNTNDICVVDLETGRNYYVDGVAYVYARDMQIRRDPIMGAVLGDYICLHSNTSENSIDIEVIRGQSWKSGLCPDWAVRNDNRIDFELSCDWWIVRGYFDDE